MKVHILLLALCLTWAANAWAAPRCLFIGEDPDAKSDDDALLVERLRDTLGLDVTAVGEDDDSIVEKIDEVDLVVISASIISSSVRGYEERLNKSATPAIAMESHCLDLLGWVPLGGEEWGMEAVRGQAAGTGIDIAMPSHPIALTARAGGEDVQVYSEEAAMCWGTAAPGADLVATAPDSPSKGTILVLEKSDSYPNPEEAGTETVPGTRIVFFATNGNIGKLTEAGWGLFDASVQYALGELESKMEKPKPWKPAM